MRATEFGPTALIATRGRAVAERRRLPDSPPPRISEGKLTSASDIAPGIAPDIAYASALDLVELYRTQTLSPVEAAEALLARAEALQPVLNAFCLIDRDGAVAAARAAERRWRDGEPLGPLDG